MASFPLSRVRTLLLLTGLAFLALACGSDAPVDEAASVTSGELTVSNAWSRLAAPGQTAAAVYAEVANGTDATRQVIGVTSTATDSAELHETVIGENGVAVMRARNDGFAVGAGETMLFEPGAPHVMLRDIDPDELAGSIDLVFEFDDGESIAVTAEVRRSAAAPTEEHGDHQN